MKRCRKCGKEIEDDSTFCPYCGTSVPDETEKKKHRQKKYVLTGTGKVLIAAGIALASGSGGVIAGKAYSQNLKETKVASVREKSVHRRKKGSDQTAKPQETAAPEQTEEPVNTAAAESEPAETSVQSSDQNWAVNKDDVTFELTEYGSYMSTDWVSLDKMLNGGQDVRYIPICQIAGRTYSEQSEDQNGFIEKSKEDDYLVAYRENKTADPKLRIIREYFSYDSRVEDSIDIPNRIEFTGLNLNQICNQDLSEGWKPAETAMAECKDIEETGQYDYDNNIEEDSRSTYNVSGMSKPKTVLAGTDEGKQLVSLMEPWLSGLPTELKNQSASNRITPYIRLASRQTDTGTDQAYLTSVFQDDVETTVEFRPWTIAVVHTDQSGNKSLSHIAPLIVPSYITDDAMIGDSEQALITQELSGAVSYSDLSDDLYATFTIDRFNGAGETISHNDHVRY